MPAVGKRVLAELRAARHAVISTGGKVRVDRSSRLSEVQREALRDNKRSLLLALELEHLATRIHTPAELRALDLEEHPDSGRSVGTLPLFGAEHWIAKAALHADRVPDDFALEPPPRRPSP